MIFFMVVGQPLVGIQYEGLLCIVALVPGGLDTLKLVSFDSIRLSDHMVLGITTVIQLRHLCSRFASGISLCVFWG